jgi:hypothetical protein
MIDPKEVEQSLHPTHTGQESPQSQSVVAYYKGFSVTVTKRDPNAKIKPLIDDAMVEIDYMIEQGFLPSWNTETNNTHLSPEKTAVSHPTSPQARLCPKCGNLLVEAKKKDGTPYLKCSTNKWDKFKKVATGCDYVDWGN